MARTPPWRSPPATNYASFTQGPNPLHAGIRRLREFLSCRPPRYGESGSPSLEVAARDHAGLEFASNRAKRPAIGSDRIPGIQPGNRGPSPTIRLPAIVTNAPRYHGFDEASRGDSRCRISSETRTGNRVGSRFYQCTFLGHRRRSAAPRENRGLRSRIR